MLNNIDPEQLDLVKKLLQQYYLYAAIAIIVLLIGIGTVIYFLAREKFKNYLTLAFGIALGCSLLIGFSLTSLVIANYYLNDYFNLTFWLLLGLFALVLVIAVTAYILKAINSPAFKIFMLISLAVIFVYSAAIMAFAPVSDEVYTPQNPVLFYALSIALMAAIAVFALLGKGTVMKSTKAITYAAACIAVGYALSYIKLFSLPKGGSVTLASLLPLMLYSYMFGTKNGVIAGLVYGLLQFFQEPFACQPMQVFLDYPLAFGSIGLAGIMRGRIKNIMHVEFGVGAVIACVMRFASHYLSGLFVFYSGAGDMAPWLYSMVYNSFVFVDAAIAIAVGLILLASKSFRKIVTGVIEQNDSLSTKNTQSEN